MRRIHADHQNSAGKHQRNWFGLSSFPASPIALALFIAKWIGQFFEKWINSLPTMESNVRVVIIRVVKVVLVTIAILIGLASVIDITVLGVFGGANRCRLRFRLQKIASNYVRGFIILRTRASKSDDLVNVSGVEEAL